MTGRILANRLLEADEDANVSGEIERLTSSPYANIELESEGNHWNVYKKNANPGPDAPPLGFIGEIYYDDMTSAPPDAHPQWNELRWTAVAGFREAETECCRSFREALDFIVAVNTAKTARPVGEAADPDDPGLNIEQFARTRSKPVARYVTNHEGREFKVRIVWDKATGSTTEPVVEFYDMTRADDPQPPALKGKGQFVSSYYASSLVDRAPDTGLDLQGGVPEWQIDWRTMNDVAAWLKQEVETRGYRLKDNLYGKTYEGLDPDDPELYAHPERYTQQPSHEKIEGMLRRMLAPYYTRVNINRRPGLFAGREMIQRNVPGEPADAEHHTAFQDGWVWTIHCDRDTPLPLPARTFTDHMAYLSADRIDWRAQVKSWFDRWAGQCGLHLFSFKIYGRLRKDPTFQFETARIGTLKESEDDPSPETMLAHYAATTDWTTDLHNDLWKFHPYGVGYDIIDLKRAVFVIARTYFPPEKDDYGQRFRRFIQDWFEQKRIFPVQFVNLYSSKHSQRTGGYDQWSVIAAVNLPWPFTPPDALIEPREPGASVGGNNPL